MSIKRYRVRAHYKEYYQIELEAHFPEEALRIATLEKDQSDFINEGDGEWVIETDTPPEEIKDAPHPESGMEWNPDSHWDVHPDYPPDCWALECEADDTRVGYVVWVNSQIELNTE